MYTAFGPWALAPILAFRLLAWTVKVNVTVAVLILSVPLANLLVTSCYVCVASQSFYPKTVSSRTELDEIGFLKTFDLFIQQTSSDLTDDWEEVRDVCWLKKSNVFSVQFPVCVTFVSSELRNAAQVWSTSVSWSFINAETNADPFFFRWLPSVFGSGVECGRGPLPVSSVATPHPTHPGGGGEGGCSRPTMTVAACDVVPQACLFFGKPLKVAVDGKKNGPSAIIRALWFEFWSDGTVKTALPGRRAARLASVVRFDQCDR